MENFLTLSSINSKLQILENIQETFLLHFSNFGCSIETPVKISSGIDPSVRFIGSHISVFKKYLLDMNLPHSGVVLVQDCIRTRNINKYIDPNFYPVWGSFFTSLGGLIPITHLESVATHAINYFTQILKLDPKIFFLRVSSIDKDLLAICKSNYDSKNIEIDAKELNYYRHSIGLDIVAGRNFNFALFNEKLNTLEDIGNFIILEKNGTPHSIEIALGTTTIIKIVNSFEHILDCYPLSLNIPNEANRNLKRQLEDVIITSSRLMAEGLIPSNKDNRARILKKYINCVLKISSMVNFVNSELLNKIEEYELELGLKEKPLYTYLKNIINANAKA